MAPSLIVWSRVIHVPLLFLCSNPGRLTSVHARSSPHTPTDPVLMKRSHEHSGRISLNIAQKKNIGLSRIIKPPSLLFFFQNPTSGLCFRSVKNGPFREWALVLFFPFFCSPPFSHWRKSLTFVKQQRLTLSLVLRLVEVTDTALLAPLRPL